LTTAYNMATPPTPIATLFQSRLYVFYDVLILTLAIAMILLPCVAGVAVALLRPLRKLGEGVEGVD
jgi:hypothetical protein